MSKTYQFKYRLTQKSSLATIAKAVRALGMELKIEKRGVSIFWMEEVTLSSSSIKEMFRSNGMLDERVPDWLNEKLEDRGLLAPNDLEP